MEKTMKLTQKKAKSEFSSKEVAYLLRFIRDDIRTGKYPVVNKEFKQHVVFYMGFNDEKKLLCASEGVVNNGTAERFGKLFAVPAGQVTQDDYAWAIQNFINRRAEPWAFWYSRKQAKNAVRDVQEFRA
jgi:hypothetical protein